MRVECEVHEAPVENERGFDVAGVRAECGRCNHVTTCFGIEDRSIKRALVKLREECPRGEQNFYVNGDE